MLNGKEDVPVNSHRRFTLNRMISSDSRDSGVVLSVWSIAEITHYALQCLEGWHVSCAARMSLIHHEMLSLNEETRQAAYTASLPILPHDIANNGTMLSHCHKHMPNFSIPVRC